jgi:DNA-binding GntR family transcriptional regulator
LRASHPRVELGPPTKADAAYLELRDQILRGGLAPGERIDQELLANSLGLSTTPLREALRRLESEQLVVRSAHRDVVVAPLSFDEARQLFEVRMELDVFAIRGAVSAMTEAELAEADSLIAAKTNERAASYLRRHGIAHQPEFAGPRAFHHLLFAGSHNPVLIEILEGLWARTERYAILVRAHSSDRSEPNRNDHKEMVAAIRSHDEARAESLMRSHNRIELAVEDFLESRS